MCWLCAFRKLAAAVSVQIGARMAACFSSEKLLPFGYRPHRGRLSCCLRFPESGRAFIRHRTTEIGTFLPLAISGLNDLLCQKLTQPCSSREWRQSQVRPQRAAIQQAPPRRTAKRSDVYSLFSMKSVRRWIRRLAAAIPSMSESAERGRRFDAGAQGAPDSRSS